MTRYLKLVRHDEKVRKWTEILVCKHSLSSGFGAMSPPGDSRQWSTYTWAVARTPSTCWCQLIVPYMTNIWRCEGRLRWATPSCWKSVAPRHVQTLDFTTSCRSWGSCTKLVKQLLHACFRMFREKWVVVVVNVFWNNLNETNRNNLVL